MYNAHRGVPPQVRLNELLDQVRAEFDNQTNRSGEYEQQSPPPHLHNRSQRLTLNSFEPDAGDGDGEEQNLRAGAGAASDQAEVGTDSRTGAMI
jgi:hypothetical protein